MEPNSTAQNGAAVGTPPANATGGNSNQQDPNQTQVPNTSVDGGNGADNGNSSSNDGGDGSNRDDGGRGRPSRAQRTINELTAKYREAEAKLADNADLITRLTQGVDPSKVNIPEYKPGEELTPERIKQDVTTAASQIAAMTIAPAIKELAGKIIQRDGARDAVKEMREAVVKYPKLDEGDEDHYDPDLANRIEKSYERFFEKDPTYGFEEHLELFGPELKSTTSRNSANAGSRSSSRGTGINRGSGGASRRSAKPFEDMSLEEMEAHIHQQNG